MAIWSVSSTTRNFILTDVLDLPNASGVQSIIIDDKSGRFFASQMGSVRTTPPMFLAPMALGDMPFSTSLTSSPSIWDQRKKWSIDVQNAHTSGVPLPLLTSPVDETSLFITRSGWRNSDVLSHLIQKRNASYISGTISSMFLPNVPSTAFSTSSCDILSEIQRHMLEATIDGGLTWSPLWEKEKIQRYFNERMSRFFLETGVVQEEFSVPVTSGTSQYNYPSDLVQTKRLTFSVPEESTLNDGLVSFWKLDEATGLPRLDSNGNNNFTNINGVSFINGHSSNGASHFIDASTQYLVASANSTQDLIEALSIAGWVKWNDIGAGQGFLGKSNFLVSAGWGLGITSPGYLVFGTSTTTLGTDFTRTESAIGTIPNGTWCHIAATYDGAGIGNAGRAKLYINGVETPETYSGTIPTQLLVSTADLIFGAQLISSIPTPGRSLEGDANLVGLWNRALSSAEVADLYTQSFPFIGETNEFVALPRVDPFTLDNGSPEWEDDTGTPSSIIEEPRSPLSFQLCPIPDVDGSVEGIYVADPTPIDDTCTLLPIPNFLTWIIKYGVMADMLNQEGEANDPQRGEYCENRWKEGIQLTRVLLGWGGKGDE